MSTAPDHNKSSNPDPLTGEPGAHPVAVGIGAAAGGMATGAVAGTLAAGPVGTVVGAAIGAVAGGLGGKAVGEHSDPTVESDYWRAEHAKQAYAADGEDYDAYEPAYRLGGMRHGSYEGQSFDEAEPALSRDYEGMKGDAHVDWEKAKHATRAAWDRMTSRS